MTLALRDPGVPTHGRRMATSLLVASHIMLSTNSAQLLLSYTFGEPTERHLLHDFVSDVLPQHIRLGVFDLQTYIRDCVV